MTYCARRLHLGIWAPQEFSPVTRKDHTTVTETKQNKQDIALNLSLKLCVMKLRLLLGIQVSSKLVFLGRCIVFLNRRFPTPTWLCLATQITQMRLIFQFFICYLGKCSQTRHQHHTVQFPRYVQKSPNIHLLQWSVGNSP